MARRIQVIVNPAAGQDAPILNIMNRIFREAGVEWDISLTKEAGDARRLAQEAAQRGVDVVAVYGGDGTVAEVASGLVGSQVPLAILPGGTANVLSVELGIPADLALACQLAANPEAVVRPLDMGTVNGDYFILRVGIGFEAAMVEKADRESKDKYGVLAYLWSAMQNLYKPEIAKYHLTIDGQSIEAEGLTCMIANSGNMGQAGLNLIPTIDVGDGLLDVIVIHQASLQTFFDLVGSITGFKQMQSADVPAGSGVPNDMAPQSLQYWQAKEVTVVTEPTQTVQCDGEILGKIEVQCKVVPHAINVLTPNLPKPATT